MKTNADSFVLAACILALVFVAALLAAEHWGWVPTPSLHDRVPDIRTGGVR